MRDFDYYAGTGLKYPTRPTKPVLARDHTSQGVIEYGNALAEWELDAQVYREERDEYNQALKARQREFAEDLRAAHDLNERQAALVFARAWENRHSESLRAVAEEYADLVAFVEEYVNDQN